MSLTIGTIRLKNPFIMAPLAGITDSVTRGLCFEFGAAMTFTEMVSAKGIFYDDKKTADLTYIPETAGPTAIQIFGSEPEVMAYAARKLDKLNNVAIDINMGCPVPKVVKNGDGSALLKDTEAVYEVTKAVVDNSGKPVTVKIRKGFDDNSINAVENAKAIEAAGAAAVTIHGRTREQYYSGQADWDIIANVKKAVDIPVFGNGDVFTAFDGIRLMQTTGCDGVMVARGAIGNPWIFRELCNLYTDRKQDPAPDKKAVSDMMIRHLDELSQLRGKEKAVREFRKFVVWYTKGLPGASKLRNNINNIIDIKEMKEVLSFDAW